MRSSVALLCFHTGTCWMWKCSILWKTHIKAYISSPPLTEHYCGGFSRMCPPPNIHTLSHTKMRLSFLAKGFYCLRPNSGMLVSIRVLSLSLSHSLLHTRITHMYADSPQSRALCRFVSRVLGSFFLSSQFLSKQKTVWMLNHFFVQFQSYCEPVVPSDSSMLDSWNHLAVTDPQQQQSLYLGLVLSFLCQLILSEPQILHLHVLMEGLKWRAAWCARLSASHGVTTPFLGLFLGCLWSFSLREALRACYDEWKVPLQLGHRSSSSTSSACVR